MSGRPIVVEPDEVDGPWLTATLQESGVARGATVTDVRLDGFIGTGQMGRNARFALTWNDPTERPTSIVGKFAALDATARASGFSGSYLKEWAFYKSIRPTVDIRTPEPYAAVWDETEPAFVLLLEDLSGSTQGDQFIGLTVDEAALGVEQAVALHAPRWGDDTLLVLHNGSIEESVTRLTEIYALTMDAALARHASVLTDDVVTLVRELAPYVGLWVRGTGTPSTLVHMDFRPDNFLFGVKEDAPPLAVVDWQTFSYGAGTNDLAYMIGGGFEPAERAAVERDLVRDYCDRLRAQGIAYEHDACWRDYCVNSLWGVIMSVIATILAQETDRGNAMLSTMLRRHAHHALDVDALTLLRELQP